MLLTGITPAVLSGLFNSLFAAPVKFESRWRWDTIWLVPDAAQLSSSRAPGDPRMLRVGYRIPRKRVVLSLILNANSF